jgi:hypothetical protein
VAESALENGIILFALLEVFNSIIRQVKANLLMVITPLRLNLMAVVADCCLFLKPKVAKLAHYFVPRSIC